MPRLRIAGLGAALTAYDVWRRIPPAQRKLILAQARVHGPKLAKKAIAARKAIR